MTNTVARLKRLALVIVIAAAAWGSNLVAFGAPVAEASCDEIQIRLWEDANFSGESLIFCFPANISNLHDFANSFDGCNVGGWVRWNWGDCVSSFQVTRADCHYRALLYVNTNYGNVMPWTSWGNKIAASMGGDNDALSSIRFQYREDCP